MRSKEVAYPLFFLQVPLQVPCHVVYPAQRIIGSYREKNLFQYGTTVKSKKVLELPMTCFLKSQQDLKKLKDLGGKSSDRNGFS